MSRRSGLCAIFILVSCKREEPVIVDWCSEEVSVRSAERTPHRDGLIYEVYVRSFRDADGDGIGDLAGVREKLDYLEWLGVSTLWLMPVFEASSRAGYDATDFDAIEPDYGDEDDLRALIDDAAARDIEILLDLPLNHSSASHPWFQAGLEDDRADEEAWYLWSNHQWDDLRWFEAENDRYYYAFFGEGYPDLDWTNQAVAEAMLSSLNGWLDAGVGGFRLDAVIQLIEEDGDIADTESSHCLLAWLTGELEQEHPDALLLSEAWHQTVPGNVRWLGSEAAPEADLIIDVPRRHVDEDAWTSGDPSEVAAVLAQQIELGVTEQLAGYLSAHDTPRFGSRVEDPAARRAWMVAHLLLPGQPILYYGDEIDMTDSSQWSGHDAPQRGPMAWNDEIYAGFSEAEPWFGVDDDYLEGVNVEAQQADPDSLLQLVVALSELRRGSAALREGSLELLEVSPSSVLAFRRAQGDEQVLAVLNFGETETEVSVALEGEWVDLSDGGLVTTGATGSLGVLGPRGYRVLATESLASYAVAGPVD